MTKATLKLKRTDRSGWGRIRIDLCFFLVIDRPAFVLSTVHHRSTAISMAEGQFSRVKNECCTLTSQTIHAVE